MKVKFFIIIAIWTLSSCVYSNVFEKNVSLKGFKWNANQEQSFTFKITDTTADYNMFFTMRHTESYPYSNIWLNIQTIFPGSDTSVQSKIEVPLADLDGKWLGRGMNEVRELWEHQMLIASPLHFSKTGEYTIKLNQIMRVNPLPEVMSVGIRLEKVGKGN